LRNRDYCHFHLDQIGRQLRAARSRARHLPSRLKLPLLEDPFAVQVALMQMADAITYNEIDVQRGRLLMSVLRLASRNLTAARAWKQDALFVAEENAETAIAEWPSFEQENELPQDFDLSLDPELAFPPPQENVIGAAPNPDVGMYGNNATEGPSSTASSVLRARIRQALGEAEPSAPAVTADQVELMDIYERQGEKAAAKFADQMVRNDGVENADRNAPITRSWRASTTFGLRPENWWKSSSARPAQHQHLRMHRRAMPTLPTLPVRACASSQCPELRPSREETPHAAQRGRKSLRLKILPVSTSRIKILGVIHSPKA
jgi:hypothetical protein